MTIKDPAFSFYYLNYLHGTRRMTFEQKGAYVELLCEQADKGAKDYTEGFLTIQNIKDILQNSYNSVWIAIQSKFINCDGKYYNQRLFDELKKRQEYSKSRSCNRKNNSNISLSHEKDMNKLCFSYPLNSIKLNSINLNSSNSSSSELQEQPKNEQTFDIFRKAYPGTKRGLKTEYSNFCKKHKNNAIILPLLTPAIENQIKWRAEMEAAGMFVPAWKNLQTWINQSCWETEKPLIERKRQKDQSERPDPPRYQPIVSNEPLAGPDELAEIKNTISTLANNFSIKEQ